MGNKSDLQDKKAVDDEDLKKIIDDLEFDLYLETSAKNGKNVEKLFIEASKMLYDEYLNLTINNKKKADENTENNAEDDNNNKVELSKTNDKEKPKNKCKC